MKTFRENYSEQPGPGRESLIAFVREIHGLDLTLWNELGFWDAAYRPFTFFEGDEIVSSVCLYSLDMVVGGQRSKVAQISGVGTREDSRRCGLSRELTRKAMAWARETGHDHFFLFADGDAIPFYERMEFSATEEYRPWVPVESTLPRAGARKLDMNEAQDRALLVEIGSRRASVSLTLGVMNLPLLLFHALYTLRDNLYYLPKLQTIVAVKRSDWGLVIEDVIAEQIPSFEQIYPYLCGRWDLEVRFGFVPDRLGLAEWNTHETSENNLFLFAPLPLPTGRLFVPFTAHA